MSPGKSRLLGPALASLTLATAVLGALTAPAAIGSPPVEEAFAPQLVTVDTPARSDKQHLQLLGLDLTEHAGHDYVEVVLHTAADLDRLAASGLTWDVRIPDLVAREAEINRINAEYAAATSVSPLPSGRTTYRTLADYEADMTALAKREPGLVKKFALARPSLDGLTIHGIEIGSDVRRPASGRPTFVLLGLHHAREWPSGELAMEFAIDLVENYGRSDRITRLLNQARVIVVPVVNVDGFDLSRTDGEIIDLRDLNEADPLGGTGSVAATPGHAYKRKNCRLVDGEDTPDGSCRGSATSNIGAGAGVDLNRNYGGLWGGPGAAASEPDPDTTGLGVLDPTYRGAGPFSEPETRNIRDLIASRQVTMMISNHTFSNLVLRPNGVNPQTEGPDGAPVGDAHDEAALKRLGARMAAQNGYANIHGWQLYDTTGTTEDWSYNTTGGFGYTFEIGPDEFHPPFPAVVDEYLGAGKYAGKGNREAYLIALEHAVDTRFHGVLTGRAPAGAVLRLTKEFRTPTWNGSFRDGVTSTLLVGRSGAFRWVVNPSTRPVVDSHRYLDIADRPSDTQSWTDMVAPAGANDHLLKLAEPVHNLHIELDWPTPDDLDLEVYYKRADGSLQEVASSGNLPGEKESTDVVGAAAGTYVLRVINYASVSPTYTLTASQYDAVTRYTDGAREFYVLTCEKNGRVLQTLRVYLTRGQEMSLPLGACRQAW